MAASALKPVRLSVLHTETAHEQVAVVRRFLGERCDLAFKTCDGTSPSSVAADVEGAGARLSDGSNASVVVVDVTGGKKLMSAAAAVAAVRRQYYFCYVEGDYDPDLRRPRPGTERLLVFDHALCPVEAIQNRI